MARMVPKNPRRKQHSAENLNSSQTWPVGETPSTHCNRTPVPRFLLTALLSCVCTLQAPSLSGNTELA